MRVAASILSICFLLATNPVSAQSYISESCPIPVDPETGEELILTFNCQITVTGNLRTAMSERTESVFFNRSIVTNDVERELGVFSDLQQFRRSDSRSANPTSQGVTMRGLGGNAASRSLLFLDDVPQADPFGGWVAWTGYDALELASIRIRKGGGLPSAGPGTIAGVIELDTKKVQGSNLLAAGFGSRNSFDARGRFATKLGAGSLTVGSSYSRSDGFIPVIASQRGIVDHGAAYEQAGLSINATAPVSEDTEIQIGVRGYVDKRDRGVEFSDNSNSGIDASMRLVDRKGDWQWSATAYLQTRDFSSEFGAVSADRSTVTPTLDQFATPSNGVGLRFELRPPLGEKLQLRTGGEWRRTSGETQENFTYVSGVPTRLRNAGGAADIFGGFAELSYAPTDKLTFSAGGRLDKWILSEGFRREVNIGGAVRSDNRFRSRDNIEWTGRVGFGWEALEDFRLTGSAYRAWRLPTLNELYRPFRVGADATAANESLLPEYVEGFEVGAAYTSSGFNIDAVYFDNRLEGAIANVSIAAGPGNFPGVGFVAAGGIYRQRQNLDAISSRGVELYVGVDIVSDFELALSYSLNDASVKGSGLAASLNGLRPAQVPRHSARASLLYGSDEDKGIVTLRYIGRQFEDDLNSRVLRDALAVDFAVNKAITDNLFIEIRGDNIFDATVEAAVSATGVVERATPRTLWLGARWNFQ